MQKPVVRLNVKPLDGESAEYSLEFGSSIDLGRSESSDIRINTPKVSRFHAAVRSTEEGIVVQDLGSLNGTFVNGKLIGGTTRLSNGDRIYIGGTEIKVEFLGDASYKENGSETRPGELQLYRGSILVSDIRGYTRLSEALPAQELAAVLRVWTEKVAAVIGILDGKVDKFLGDSVLAYWFRPALADSPSDDQLAERAFAAAKRIQSETLALENSVLWPFAPRFRWRVKSSLATGEMIFGNVGRGEARSFTVFGDTVNIAFRLNDLCSENDLELVSDEETAKLVNAGVGPAKPRFSFLRETKLEGKESLVKLYCHGS